MSDSTALFLTSDEVDGLASPGEYVDAVRSGYEDRGRGAPARPRTALFSDDPGGMLTSYVAVLPDVGAMGGYVYSAGFASTDAHFALPLFDAETGEPLAVFDGASLNPFKTGATGALGVDALARPDASTLAVFGSGPQAREQLRAIATVRDLDSVCVYSPTRDHREAFATEMDDRLAASVGAVDAPAAALGGADVVVTATDASEPVFDAGDLDAGTHVTAMGQYHPSKRELDEQTVEQSTYVLDLRDRATQDAGSFIHARDAGVVDESHVHAELGAVLVGDRPGRTDDDEITVFDSGGTAIETVAAAKMLYDRARDRGLGSAVEFAPASRAMIDETD